MRIAVTGGNGKLGRSVVADLREAGHTVIVLDRAGSAEAPRGSFVDVDMTDYGQVLDALSGVDDRHSGLDALVHLAAIPASGIKSDVATFEHNMLATFHAFHAARRAGITRIVYASSETTLGIPFDVPPPYLPVDEQYPLRPQSTYALVKHLEEELAIQLTRWNPELSITALRFSNVMDPADYAAFPSFDADASLRRWNLWAYIDGRDGAQAVRKSLETREPGFEALIIAAADSVMTRSSAGLAAEVFPDVTVTKELGENETLLSIDKARRLIGYDPQHSWRDHV